MVSLRRSPRPIMAALLPQAATWAPGRGGYNRALMELAPRLIEVSTPPAPAGAVLVLHGGASRRRSMRVSPAQLSVLRMVPIASRIARAGRDRLAVFRL